ncbi:unnamed protein product [Blepharisma stoltei]|uniref:Uncharacterized protein n=1 Tax=Blepharisma stoltei TaxID=1481888 RepID=A0AAU9IGN2_9CILI|nr:unnamed protein product [Blepharisma stoltei]
MSKEDYENVVNQLLGTIHDKITKQQIDKTKQLDRRVLLTTRLGELRKTNVQLASKIRSLQEEIRAYAETNLGLEEEKEELERELRVYAVKITDIGDKAMQERTSWQKEYDFQKTKLKHLERQFEAEREEEEKEKRTLTQEIFRLEQEYRKTSNEYNANIINLTQRRALEERRVRSLDEKSNVFNSFLGSKQFKYES